MTDLRDELRQKYPGLARKADHEGSRTSAINLKCRECMGGSLNDVKSCTATKCFLHPYRPGAQPDEVRPVPTIEEYREMSDRPDPTWLYADKGDD